MDVAPSAWAFSGVLRPKIGGNDITGQGHHNPGNMLVGVRAREELTYVGCISTSAPWEIIKLLVIEECVHVGFNGLMLLCPLLCPWS